MGLKCHQGRREFLAAVSASLASTALTSAKPSSEIVGQSSAPGLLPTIRLGDHQVTRLIAGWNPIGGYSYLGPNMDQHMREYFTAEKTVEFLLNCRKAGINAHQFDPNEQMVKVLETVRESTTDMNFICLHSGSSRHGSVEEVIKKTKPIALSHHGGVTDKLFREGKSQIVHDYVKKAHDHGVLAGVSAHNPENIKRIADEGWENDFFMACFYYVTRYYDQPDLLEGKKTVGMDFFSSDTHRMTDLIRQIDKPCLGFKILAAGRAPFEKKGVEEAFAFAFKNIKPIDAVIVGMYPRFRDEIGENTELTKKLASLSEVT